METKNLLTGLALSDGEYFYSNLLNINLRFGDLIYLVTRNKNKYFQAAHHLQDTQADLQ